MCPPGRAPKSTHAWLANYISGGLQLENIPRAALDRKEKARVASSRTKPAVAGALPRLLDRSLAARSHRIGSRAACEAIQAERSAAHIYMHKTLDLQF